MAQDSAVPQKLCAIGAGNQYLARAGDFGVSRYTVNPKECFCAPPPVYQENSVWQALIIQAFLPSLRSIPTIVPLNRVLASRTIASSSVPHQRIKRARSRGLNGGCGVSVGSLRTARTPFSHSFSWRSSTLWFSSGAGPRSSCK
jgi:hypothetical protein